ncbi:MAG: hypothetical protein ABI808_11970 [Pseudonocardiales bacterium]
MRHERAKRTVRAVNVALVALAVCLGSGLSPATAAAQGSDRQRTCHHPSASCQAEHNRDRGEDSYQHKRKHHHIKFTDQPANPSPSGPTRIGTQPGGPATDGGQPGEHTPSVGPSGTFQATATTTVGSTESAMSTVTAPSTAATTAKAVPAEAADPAAAAPNSVVPLISQDDPPRRTPVNTAPTGGGQLPQPASSVKATRSSAASTSSTDPIAPRPALAAPIDPPLGETVFGIDAPVLLAAMVGLFTLAVTVMVAGGHRRVRRIH